MKPASFEYFDPRTVAETISLLAQYGGDGKILAGGQSLVPLMNLRLAKPPHLIDINRVAELDYIRAYAGGLAIGAVARQRTVERSELVRQRCPLLAEAIRFVGHAEIRNRGTVAGSIAHADPAAELPAVAMALRAELVILGRQGERVASPAEFFLSFLTTSLGSDELLAEVRFPAWPARTGWAFQEVSRRHGDFAIVGVAAVLGLDEAGVCRDARLVCTGVGGTPVASQAAGEVLIGRRPDERGLAEVGRRVGDELEPESDVHASAEYRREVAGVLARRALATALARAAQ